MKKLLRESIYIGRVNRFPDLTYVYREVTIKYIANIKLKRLIIEKFRAAILKSKMAATWCEF